MRRSAPVKIKVYYPQTEVGRQELERRVANVHSDFVAAYINNLNIPIKEKLRMLDSVISSKKKERAASR